MSWSSSFLPPLRHQGELPDIAVAIENDADRDARARSVRRRHRLLERADYVAAEPVVLTRAGDARRPRRRGCATLITRGPLHGEVVGNRQVDGLGRTRLCRAGLGCRLGYRPSVPPWAATFRFPCFRAARARASARATARVPARPSRSGSSLSGGVGSWLLAAVGSGCFSGFGLLFRLGLRLWLRLRLCQAAASARAEVVASASRADWAAARSRLAHAEVGGIHELHVDRFGVRRWDRRRCADARSATPNMSRACTSAALPSAIQKIVWRCLRAPTPCACARSAVSTNCSVLMPLARSHRCGAQGAHLASRFRPRASTPT